jgi:hypothetical protein
MPTTDPYHALAGLIVADAESFLRGTLGSAAAIKIAASHVGDLAALSFTRAQPGQCGDKSACSPLATPCLLAVNALLGAASTEGPTDHCWREALAALVRLLRAEAYREGRS